MKKILVPSGYSAASANAITYAGTVAASLNRELVFFQTGIPVPESFSDAANSQEEMPEPVDMIALREFMGKNHADLVVMGMHEEGEEGYPGSLVPAMDELKCPVILVPPGYTTTRVGKIGLATAIAQLDRELGKVISFARCFNAEIEILHVSSWTADIAGFEKINLRQQIETAKRIHQYANISYGVEEMPVDNENENINSFLTEKKVDLLAIFQHTSPEIESLYGVEDTGSRFSRLRIPVIVFPR
jgi:hypothetical protein